MTRHIKFLIICAGVAAHAATSLACPAYIPAEKVAPLQLKARKDLRAFSIVLDEGKRSWVMLPLQIDEMDQRGVLVGSNPDKPLATTDRISMRIEKFGERMTTADRPPCLASQGIEIENPGKPGQFAYMTFCEDEVAQISMIPVNHNAEAKKVSAPHYDYEYLPNNQLMYKSLVAKDSSWSAPLPAASNADLALHLDIKRFLTLNFTNKNVESYVGKSASGPVGMVGSIDFFLRLLFLKIDLKLGTTVGFYGDSAHIPSIIDVPVDAYSRLNSGSGLLYQWQQEEAKMDRSHPENSMPNADVNLVKSGWEAYAKEGLRYCKNNNCSYNLRGSIGSLPYGLDIYLQQSMVERGFYPVWVSDVGKFKKDMGWSYAPTDDGRVGIYFNNSGLAKGQYPMNQWIRLGSTGMLGQCPAPVTLGPTVKFDDSSKTDNIAH